MTTQENLTAYNDYADDDVQLHQCIYCDVMLDGPEPDHAPPAVEEDEAWEGLSKDHNDWCEWIATRAHRRVV